MPQNLPRTIRRNSNLFSHADVAAGSEGGAVGPRTGIASGTRPTGVLPRGVANWMAGLLAATTAIGMVGCAGSSESERSVARADAAEAKPAFTIGASEWSRGGRRDASKAESAAPVAAPGMAPAPMATDAEQTRATVAEVDPEVEPPVEPVLETVADQGEPVATAQPRAVALETRPATPEPSGAPAAEARRRSDDPEARVAEASRVVIVAEDRGRSEGTPRSEPARTASNRSSASSATVDDASEAATPTTVAAADAEPAATPPAAMIGTRETARSGVGATGPERPLSTDPIEAATSILVAGARSPDPVVRANALEGMLAWPSLLREHVAGGLVDDNRGVRFVAAMCVGRSRLADLAHLVQPLLRDRSESVRAAAIYALRRCGRPADPSPLASMVRSDDPEIRSNAYIVLGELGDPSSAGMVRDSLGRGMRRVHPIRVRVVELQAAETLIKLGSDDELEVVRAALFAPVEQGELSILACQILARLGDRSAAPMLERLVLASGTSARPPEIRMAATQALAELGSRTRIDAASIAVDAMRTPDPLLRAQGCAVAGAAGGTAAIEGLRDRLSDPVEFVRITAAGNLLKATAESSSVVDATGLR